MAYKDTTLYAPSGASYGLAVSFNENSTSQANNSSNITCVASLWSINQSGWSSSTNSTLTLYWHDNRENYDRYVASVSFSSLAGGSYKEVSGTIDVTHNNDGSLSGYAYVYFGKGGTSSYAPSSSGLQTNWTALTTIARYPTLTSGSNFTDIQNPVYTIANSNTTYNVRVKIEVGTQYQLITRDLGVGFKGTYTLELTEAERNTLRALTPNSKTLAVRETVCAMSGNTEVNVSYKSYTMTIVDASPTFDSSYLDSNSTTTAITGDNQQIIRNQSTLEIDVSNATAYKYATLSSIKATINGTIYNATLSGGNATFNIGTLNVSSNTNAVVTLTDSRGFTATQTLELEILNWELPTAIINLQRENNYYSNTNINVDANYSSLDSHNTITLKTRYKKVTHSSYGSYVTLQDNVTSTLNLDNNYQWDVQVLVQDLLGQTTYNLTLDRGIPIIYFDRMKRSMGINCFPEYSTSLELNGNPVGASNNTYNASATDTYSCNYINGLNTYSTTEHRIGTWINGKPIYRKVFTFTTPSNDDDYIINTGLSMDKIIKVYGGIAGASGGVTPIPYAIWFGTTPYYTTFRVSVNKIYYKGSSAYGNTSAYAIIEYTKTTD
jgi:hypothetical protein